MLARRLLGIVVPLLFAASATIAIGADAPLVVTTDTGPVRGAVEDGVLSFKGIPFAQPPIGQLRWRAPQPPKPWAETIDASKYRADCMQPVPDARTTPTSEDCLYLNVFRHAGEATRPLPVFVWIYGGALVRGGASIYPAQQLAKRGLLVVSFNYRLGRFGFFAHPALAAESPVDVRGNYGYLDQIAALQWVKRNIAAFGGDPDKVTIAGESAGGGSVLVLLTSPLAQGLFHRAILQSPAMPSPREDATPMRSLADAEKIAIEYARTLDASDERALAKLRATPAAKINEGTDQPLASIFGAVTLPGLANSIVDGKLVPEAPERTLKAGRQARVPVIVGANDLDLAWSAAKTKDELFATFGARAAKARELYDPNGNADLRSLVQAVAADGVMIEPARNLAELVTAAGQPAWHYRFAYVPRLQQDTVKGAVHATDLVFMFDSTRSMLPGGGTEDDAWVGGTMAGFWAAFARTGTPALAGREPWPPYDPATKKAFVFSQKDMATVDDPLRARLDLWAEVRRDAEANRAPRP